MAAVHAAILHSAILCAAIVRAAIVHAAIVHVCVVGVELDFPRILVAVVLVALGRAGFALDPCRGAPTPGLRHRLVAARPGRGTTGRHHGTPGRPGREVRSRPDRIRQYPLVGRSTRVPGRAIGQWG